jgi:hypothetical protein
MTREFTLVLLGAGLLTAGYFAWPEEDLERRAEAQAQDRAGGNGRARTHHGGIIFIGHFGGGSSARAGGSHPAMGSVAKGGFGSTAGRIGGGLG